MLRMLADEDTDPALFSEIDDHVKSCQACRARLESLAWECRTPAVSPPHPLPAAGAPPQIRGFEIRDELGRGSMGVVYLARDLRVGRSVALKVMPASPGADEQARNRWRKEGKAFSRVRHPNVVVLHDIGEVGSWLYLVLEYIPGRTLRDRLDGPVPRREAAQLVAKVAEAVHCIHQAGVLHLDLKPANILLDGEPGLPLDQATPKVADFGIARLLTDAERVDETSLMAQGSVGGTPSYMAPEQIFGPRDQLCPATDIHALGAILYKLLTGRAAFQGASPIETMEQVRHQEPVSPRRLNPQVPRDLDTITLKCLEKNPAQRYESAEALAVDLRLWLEGRPIKARRVSAMGHAWRLCRRHPAIAALVGTLVMTVSTGVVVLFVLLNQASVEQARSAKARRNTEAFEKFSASAADQLILFLRRTIRYRNTTTPDQMTAALLSLRNSTSDLKNRGIVPTSTIGILEEEIAWSLVSLNKTEEARDLLKQAISDLKQGLAKNPENTEARNYLVDAIRLSGDLADGAGQLEDALNCFEQVAIFYMNFVPSDSNYIELTSRYMRLQSLADRLGRSGQTAQKERALHVCGQILRHLLGSDSGHLADEFPPGLETLGRLFRRVDVKKMLIHENKDIDRFHESFVSQWLALSVGTLPSFLSSSSSAKFDGDPEAGAIAFISAIRELCSKLGLPDSMVPAMTSIAVLDDAVNEARGQRNLGRLDDARATAARLMAIGRRLVRDYPESAHAYRVLSEAYNQVRKNAYKTDDDELVEQANVQAIETAQRALSLDPDRIETRRHLDILTERLAKIKADRKVAGSSLP